MVTRRDLSLAELANVERVALEHGVGAMPSESLALVAEVRRLRAALVEIEEWNPRGGTWCQGCYSETQRIAERALDGR